MVLDNNITEVRQVKFLGPRVSNDGDSRTEVNKRLTTARTAVVNM